MRGGRGSSGGVSGASSASSRSSGVSVSGTDANDRLPVLQYNPITVGMIKVRADGAGVPTF
jgi:hypothetical protein